MELAQEFLTDSVRPGAREIAITDRRKHLMEALRTDHGIADFGRCIETLAKDISTDTDETSHAWIALRHHLTEMNDAYLTNWANALDAPPPNRAVDAEGAARRITVHILGSGMHKNSLHRWLRDIQSKPAKVAPGDFLREADRRLKAPEKVTRLARLTKFRRVAAACQSRWFMGGHLCRHFTSHGFAAVSGIVRSAGDGV
jgi:hypothetical protein